MTSSSHSFEVADRVDLADVLSAGDVIAWPQALGEPTGLTRELVRRRHELPGVEVLLGMTTTDTFSSAHADRLGFAGLNGLGSNRQLARAGVMDIIPVSVFAIPSMLRSGQIKVDVAMLRVRLHPERGSVTTGFVSDITRALVDSARVVIAEVDDRIPLTGQDALLPIGAFDRFVASAGAAEQWIEDPQPSALETEVAQHVADFVPDRATIQIGVGSMPVAIARALTGHRDLGVHTGSISDVLVDLVEIGAITNAHKSLDRGVSVVGCLIGGERLAKFAHLNPMLAMRSAEYTHNPAVLAQLDNFYSINGAIEVDLTGQVNAEEIPNRYVGAVGGQPDFVRGARLSAGGRSIIALPSTTADGARSRIVSSLEGRPVTTSRSDVDVVITEYGVAELAGCTLGERRRRLVRIAHPDFRDELVRDHSRVPSISGVSS